jgi:hypothetical protein
VLVTGPTGSGKTTTLYSHAEELATEEVNVCTIEDPIEMIEPAFNQTQVHGAIDMGFAEGLRALMRQDPDIIMVGEIRDLATAEMAIQAALTGHLVFSTLHTNDSAAPSRGWPTWACRSYLISATVIGVLAQRLARTLCPACKVRDEAPRASAGRAGQALAPVRRRAALPPVGCLECRHTGYRGRAGLYELLVLTEAARDCVHPALDAAALRRQAVKDGMRPLRLAGAMKVAEGRDHIDEVLRSTPATDGSAAGTCRPGTGDPGCAGRLTWKPHPGPWGALPRMLLRSIPWRRQLVKIKSQRDFWSGLMFVAVGIGFAWGATNYSFGSSARPGPGYFPVRPGHPPGRAGWPRAVQGADDRDRRRRPHRRLAAQADGLIPVPWSCSASPARAWAWSSSLPLLILSAAWPAASSTGRK